MCLTGVGGGRPPWEVGRWLVGRWIEGSRDSALGGPGREERAFLHSRAPAI